MTEHVSSV